MKRFGIRIGVCDEKMKKFRNWIHLNDKGKKLFGDIFPDGIVPIKEVLIPSKADLTDKNKETTEKNTEIYRIDWNKLTEKQKEGCVSFIAEKNNVGYDVVFNDVSKQEFIPLRAKFVSGAGTENTELFL